jgi:NAD(P)-dependent dehydrogenase (short-subunit alcohol dehydrogenase family)
MGSHAGKVAVVTGGASGIGQAFCQRLAQDGAAVVIADLADAAETAQMVSDVGGESDVVRCDVTDPTQVEDLAQEVLGAHERCDILIHAAGIYPATPFLDIAFDEWRRVFSLNVDANYHLTQAFLPGMQDNGWGHILLVSTSVFFNGLGPFSHYTASKGAVIGFARALAFEVGDFGVTVNVVAPGLVRTPTTASGMQAESGMFEAVAAQQAIKRTELPADLVGAMAFLTSDQAAFITGQTLVVDGGWVRD